MVDSGVNTEEKTVSMLIDRKHLIYPVKMGIMVFYLKCDKSAVDRILETNFKQFNDQTRRELIFTKFI
ncbi:MAG: hypothetical protein LBC03_05255, partial [Nitrososphaerota archaeon]|nr:hypothetical protein [Nitrososphaerota archaeon]